MRTTVDLPEALLRTARERAAAEGTTLTRLLADGLQLRLSAGRDARAPRPLPVSNARGGMHAWIDPASNASVYEAADDAGDAAA